MYLLGYDIGSSSVKASLINAETGKCVASAFYPKTEAEIMAVRSGWAEQNPDSWWEYLKLATAAVMDESKAGPADIRSIGISYQMHGLVCVDKTSRFCVRLSSGVIPVPLKSDRKHSTIWVKTTACRTCLIHQEISQPPNWRG